MKHLLHHTDILSPRFARFCAVGIANALMDFFSYSALLWFAFSPYFARTASWVAACLFSYCVNRRWTFKAGDQGLMPLLRFGVVNVCSLCFGLVLLYVFKTLGCGDRLAFILSLPFTTATNYLGYRFWTFRQVDSDA
jgi:Predicted membrane protein